jgi:hypothetical protein
MQPLTCLRRTLLAVALAALAVVGRPLLAQSGQQRRPGGEGMRSMMYLERSWCAVAFELSATNAQLAALRPTYQSVWNARKTAWEKVRSQKSPQAAAAALQNSRATIDAKLKAVLTPAQWAQWQKLQKDAEARMQQFQREGQRQGQGQGKR